MDRYANDNTPFDPTDKSPAPQAEDESTPSNLRRAWDVWTSHPSNNAAMLQFGINMLSPQGSGFGGQLASGLGGAAEASTRNLAAEEEQRKELEAERIKQEESAARTTTAGAYAKQVAEGGKGGDKEALSRLQATLRAQAATTKGFQDWLSGKTFTIDDPILDAVKAKYPEIKTKGQLLNHGPAMTLARSIYNQHFTEPSEAGPATPSDNTTPPPGGFIPPAGALSGMYKGKVYYYDPVTKAPYPGQ